jgi:hypothetical protein
MRVRRKPLSAVCLKGAIAQLALLRWEFDVARSPDAYRGQAHEVWREGDVLELRSRRGEVLTRYRLRETRAAFWDPPRQAYELLVEL